MSQVRILAIDTAKQIFHVVGLDKASHVVWRKRLPRGSLVSFIAQLPPVVIGMEACGGAHHWARCFREHGHTVRLMAPQFVKPSVKSNKHDMMAGSLRRGWGLSHISTPPGASRVC